MHILSSNELADISFKEAKSKTSKAVPHYRTIGSLSVGEGLRISKSEWPLKSTPSNTLIPRRYKPQGSAFKVRTTADDSSWVVIRVK